MNYSKALRHLLSAELYALAQHLRRIDRNAIAEKVEQFSKNLGFECSEDSADFDSRAVEVAKDDLPANRTFTVSIRGDGGQAIDIIRPRSDFALYARQNKDSISIYGPDPAREKNRTAVRSMLREAMEKTGWGRLEPEIDAYLSGKPNVAVASEKARTWTSVKIALALLCVINALLAYWGQTRLHHFLDSAYLLENAHYILDGKIPYRDFSLVLPPLHHYLNAGVLWIFGDRVINLVYAGCVIQVLIVLASYWVCQLIDDRPWRNLVFAATATVSGPAVWSFCSYTIDASLMFAITMGLLLLWEKKKYPRVLGVLIGVMLGVNFLFKQNSGLAFIAGIFALLFLAKLFYQNFKISHCTSVVAGLLLSMFAFAAWLWAIDGFTGYYYDNFVLPAKLKINLGAMLTYSFTPKSVAHLPFCWLWLLMVWTMVFLCCAGWFTGTHRKPVRLLLIVPLTAFTLGCMQAQGLRTAFGMGPVMPMSLCLTYLFLEPLSRKWAKRIVFGYTIVFMIVGMHDLITAERVKVLHNIAADTVPFNLEKFQGISANRGQRDSFESAIAASERIIPKNESAFYWPGDRPFYYVTGRSCPLRHFQVLASTGFPPGETMRELDREKIKWLIVRKSTEQYPTAFVLDATPELQAWLNEKYEAVEQVNNHILYRRKNDIQ